MPDQVIMVGAGAGASAGGLAVATALGQRGVGYELLERADSIGDSWRSRYASLRLHTARSLSGLPGAPRFPATAGAGSPGSIWSTIWRDEKGWQVLTVAGNRQARAVVLETGYRRTQYLPGWPGLDTYTGEFRRSSDYREPSPYWGQRVLVIGRSLTLEKLDLEPRYASYAFAIASVSPGSMRVASVSALIHSW